MGRFKKQPKEIKEYRVNKQTVGWTENLTPFTQEKIQLEKGDLLYLQSDGYMDQFGGANNKKFKRAPLKKCIISLAHLSLPEQEKELNQTFESWRGSNEQIDDVCIMAVQI
jgi:serine phosphatase RsbU (regulator of sigma subunit)